MTIISGIIQGLSFILILSFIGYLIYEIYYIVQLSKIKIGQSICLTNPKAVTDPFERIYCYNAIIIDKGWRSIYYQIDENIYKASYADFCNQDYSNLKAFKILNMQVFVPYSNPLQCAETLWEDNRRFYKQIIECEQIIKAIDGKLAWRNHPITLMYKPHREWLENYMKCLQSFAHYKNSKDKDLASFELAICKEYNHRANDIKPDFLTEEFCNNHKKRLYTKAHDLYPQFADLGTTAENWYFVNDKLVKYINGKKIN